MNIYDFIFPLKCVGCARWDIWLCDSCRSELEWAIPICPMCAQKNTNGDCHDGCMKKEGMEGLLAIYRYEGLMQKIIKAIKYRFCRELIDVVMDGFEIMPIEADLVVPIPLHWHRENWRGFNQAEILARNLAKSLKIELGEVLVRQRATKPVAEMEAEERKKVVKGIFEVVGEVKGKRILLVDDVFTTGSTMGEAVKELKKAGAMSVWGFVLAS